MTALLETPMSEAAGEKLKPYVPRLLIEWMRDTPEERYRAIDGSLVFVDISGFTALTERLARRGKVGAEIMRDTLDGVFTVLLDEAYDWGAGLLKWGGDALLLLFDGPLHAERAARACWEMQRTLDRVGRLRVGGGTIVLRMSIGITTGKLEFFVAGSVHRELLIAGPGATETVSVEAIADAGEIGLSRAMVAALEPRCIGSAKDGIWLLAVPPDVERDRAPDVGAVHDIDIASCIPIAARAHVLLERSEPEHRTITAAFIDMMDTDDLLERLGPEVLGQGLDERLCAIQEAALKYEVPFYETDVGKGSVKALLTAGAPSSTGADEERMLRALREIMDKPGIVPMRIGVNTGKVFTGDFGPPYRRAYRVFGDAINTAARVMSKAAPGQILSTEIVLERSRTTFQTTAIEPFQAKGKALLVHASVVGHATGLRDEQPEETPLLGRDAELDAMLDAFDQVRSGEGWIIEISGAPGLGRTRLLHEFVEHVPDALVLHARCEEYESSTPYFPFRAPMRKVLGVDSRADTPEVEARLLEVLERLDPSLVPWMPLLGILLGVDLSATPETARLDEQFIRERLAEVTMQLLVSILAGTATVLAVEDVQYIDEASKDLLLRLSKAGAALRQLLVISHTDSSIVWVSPEQELRSLTLTLLPLSERQMVEIVRRATYEAPLQAHVVEDIARRSAGNALFLFELLKMVRTTGSAEMLPDSVESVISGEIDRLSPTDRTILRYASVLGATFDGALLRAAVEGDVDLDEGVWHRFAGLVEVGEDGGCKFRNTLVRDTAYEGLPYRRRRELHERVGEAIERLSGASTEEEVSTLALHYYEAQHHAKAWRYCFLAGNRAKAVAANIEAARFYERALASARRLRHVNDDERASTWILLSEVQEAGGLFDEAFGALRRATRLLDADPVARATVYGNRSRARSRLGRFTQALRETTTGLRLIEQLESKEAIAARANLHALRADIRLHQGHPRETIALAEAAVAEAMGSDALEALARAYTALDGAHQMLGEPEKAVNELKALEIYERLGNFRSLAMTELNLGVQAYSDGRWNEAVDWYRRARADCLDAGDRPRAALAGANLGELLVSQGAFDEAETVLTEARHVLRAAGRRPFALFAETQLARLSVARGFPDEGVRALELLVEEAHGIGHAGIALEITIYYAEAMIAAGDPSTALDVLEAADSGSMSDEAALLAVPLARVRASCLMALGRDEEARACLGEALAGAERQGLLYEQLRLRQANVELAGRTGIEVEPEELLEITRLRQLLGLEV